MSNSNRDFATIPTSGSFHRQLSMVPTAEGTAFAYWMWSNSNAHMSGLWELNHSKASRELRLSHEEVDSLLHELVAAKVIHYDAESGVVFNPAQARFRAHLLNGADPTKKQNTMIKPTMHHIGSMLDSPLAKVCLATLVDANPRIPVALFCEHYGWSVSDLGEFALSGPSDFGETRQDEERREERGIACPIGCPIEGGEE